MNDCPSLSSKRSQQSSRSSLGQPLRISKVQKSNPNKQRAKATPRANDQVKSRNKPKPKDIHVETSDSKINNQVSAYRSGISKEANLQSIQSPISQSGSQTQQQKTFTFNDTHSSQNKPVSTYRSTALDLANRQTPKYAQQSNESTSNFSNSLFNLAANCRRKTIVEEQPVKYQSLMQKKMLEKNEQFSSQKPPTLIQNIQNTKPSLVSKGETSLAQQITSSLSVSSSAKSGAAGISQSLMYLNQNRERLQQTSSADQLAKRVCQKTPSALNEPSLSQLRVPSSQQQFYKSSLTPTALLQRFNETQAERSRSDKRLPQNNQCAYQTAPVSQSFARVSPSYAQQNYCQQIELIKPNNPAFINTRNFKKKPNLQGIPSSSMVPISNQSLPVDDYNPNYSMNNSQANRFQLQGLSTGQKQSRNQQLFYSPATQPVFSTQKKYKVPILHLANPQTQSHQALSQSQLHNQSLQSIRSEINKVKRDMLHRRQKQLQRDHLLQLIDHNIISSSSEKSINPLQESKDSETSNFQSSSDEISQLQQQQLPRQRYRSEDPRLPNRVLVKDKDSGIIMMTAGNSSYHNDSCQVISKFGRESSDRRRQQQYIPTESSNKESIESMQTQIAQQKGEYIRSNRDPSQQMQTQRPVIKKHRYKQNQKYMLKQIKELSISSSLISSSAKHSICPSIYMDSKQKSFTPLYCCRGGFSKCSIF